MLRMMQRGRRGRQRSTNCAPFISPRIGSAALAATTLTQEQADFFETKIRPVITGECHECHDAKKQKGGLRLDFRDGWKKGGDSGDTIIPGNPEKSLLLKSIRHDDPDLKMPSKRPKLSDAVIADFERWIAMGAPDPRDQPAKPDTVPWEKLLADRKTWRSLQPIRNPPPPAVKNTAWSNTGRCTGWISCATPTATAARATPKFASGFPDRKNMLARTRGLR